MSSAPDKAQVAPPRPRPYRDFLTPLLHRRFTSAVLLTTCVCYAEGILMGNWKSPWEWFTYAAVRAACLIVSSLFIFILRTAQLQLGKRNAVSPAMSFWKHSFGMPAFRTFSLYLLSSALFFETYVWFAVSDMGLADTGRPYERDRVNERSVYMRSIFLVVLPASQTVIHLSRGYDVVKLPTGQAAEKTELAGDSFSRVVGSMSFSHKRVVKAISQAATATAVGTVLYWAGLHGVFWNMQYSIARTFFLVPTANGPRTLILGDLLKVLVRSFIQSILLVLLWSCVNTLYNIYIAGPPLKKGQPITNDSKDPNGSLLVGLKAKKELAKTFSFWELAIITQRFDVRRKTIYEEVERSSGATWKQILVVCVNEISAITQRIQATKEVAQPPQAAQPQPLHSLPKISSQPIRDDDIATKAAPSSGFRIRNVATEFAKLHATQQVQGIEQPIALQAIEYGKSEVNAALAKQPGVIGLLTEPLVPLTRAPYLGRFLRQTFRRRVNVVIGGSPYSRSSTIINAITAIVELAVHSIKEDIMGQVSKDIPTIVRTLSSAITNIESFLSSFAPHPTDVNFKDAQRRSVPEVEEIIVALRQGLKRIVIAHGEYLQAEGLSRDEIREVKILIGPEMSEKK